MPKIIEMPKLSDTMTEGTIAKWIVKVGDKVTTGQSVADVETDKATMEMPCFFEGTIFKIIVNAGEKAPLSAPLAIVLEDGEEAPANLDEIIAKAKAASAPVPKAEKPAAGAKKTVSAPATTSRPPPPAASSSCSSCRTARRPTPRPA